MSGPGYGRSWKKYLFASIGSALTVAQFISFFFFYNPDGIPAIRVVGWVVWAISVIFGIYPIIYFRRKGKVPRGESYTRTTILVTSGLYAVVRHPQYLAGILLNLGLMLISQHWLMAVLGTPAMILMYLDILNADDYEIEKFGEAYQEYIETVPRINFLLGIIRAWQRKKPSPKAN
jgi:protein-S-isoprenylcysteine O-methyltransferase Ste14